jgi:hypothetical protein
VAGVEADRRRLGSHHGDVLRQHCVQRHGDTIGRRAILDVDARDLAERMHTRVRPPGNGHALPDRKHLIEGSPDFTLDRALPGLCRPAAKAGPVVFECELERY